MFRYIRQAGLKIAIEQQVLLRREARDRDQKAEAQKKKRITKSAYNVESPHAPKMAT
jgi:hypothetical protein